jgi:hypothetical protein
MYVSAEAVQLGDGYMAALELPGSGKRGLELRAAVEGIGTFPGPAPVPRL